MIQFARLKIDVPISSIREEVAALTREWVAHFNQHDYEGTWSVISLRSTTGESSHIIPDLMKYQDYNDTELMLQCPSIHNLLQQFQCMIMSVRLMNLRPGSVIREHRDVDLSFEQGEVRLHIPVFTNDDVYFFSRDTRISMNEGECWYVNVNIPHRVSNLGSTDRIHLVIDCSVNDWVQNWFSKAEACTIPDEINNSVHDIIRELKLQNTETSLRIAEQMERELKEQD
jgi:aspartyl/asparaginyl beta-hydroxylase (cupin superfamily)